MGRLEASKEKRRKPSLRVSRNKTQLAIRLLAERDALDHGFQIKHDRETIAIPLTRNLDQVDLAKIKDKIPDMVVGTDEFAARENRPKTLEEYLSGNIPAGTILHVPKSFDIIGDIAILELGPELARYESRIAEAILEVHPNTNSVFAKAGSISGIERIRPLRHIAGENRTRTVHRESGCSFKVDLSTVFFSPRLSAEHQRIASQVGEGENVVDMFAGVGPFSILIAKTVKNVTVDAIDFNPEAAKLLAENVRLNKVASNVRVHSGDAQDVIRTQLKGKMDRVIMNHPSSASEFISAGCEALRASSGLIHYYTFSEGDRCEENACIEFRKGVEESNCKVEQIFRTRKVREVAPMRWQVVVDAGVIPQ